MLSSSPAYTSRSKYKQKCKYKYGCLEEGQDQDQDQQKDGCLEEGRYQYISLMAMGDDSDITGCDRRTPELAV